MTTQAPEFHLSLGDNSASNFSPNKSGALTWKVPTAKGKDDSLKQNQVLDKSFSIAKNLAEIKMKRKLMESNAQLLFNRLQALSLEEHKLKKNTSDLKKKSYELLNHRVSRDVEVNLFNTSSLIKFRKEKTSRNSIKEKN